MRTFNSFSLNEVYKCKVRENNKKFVIRFQLLVLNMQWIIFKNSLRITIDKNSYLSNYQGCKELNSI